MACSIAVTAVAVLSVIVIGAAGATTTAAIPNCSPVPPPSAETSQCQFLAYTTGYGWWDNTPPGSSTISYPVIHQTAGGTGTYADPITLAVGHEIVNGQDIPEFTPGTIWYIPNLRRYFIVEDSCGDGNDPQNGPCWNLSQANPGAQVWLDLWTDGSQVSQSTSNACESAITDNHVAIMNPADDYAVVAGSIDGASGCTQQFGDTLVTATPPPITTSTTTPPPPTTTTTLPVMSTTTATTTLPPTTTAPKKHKDRKLAKKRKLAKRRRTAKAVRGRRGRRGR
jgi:hypothetical protein